jgi:hypothetical protein
MVNVDEMSETHLRNAFKKLIREGLTPEGEVVVDKVNPKSATKALKALDTAKQAITLMGTAASTEGTDWWEKAINGMTNIQVQLNTYIEEDA